VVAFRVALSALAVVVLAAPALAQDLSGTWRFRSVAGLVNRGTICAAGSVTFNTTGAVTAGTWQECNEGVAPRSLVGGGVTVGTDRTVSGRIDILGVQGHLLPAGDAFVVLTMANQSSPSGDGLAVFVKDTTAPYVQEDLTGTWRLHVLQGGELPTTLTEQGSGTVVIGPTGAVTGGTLTFFGEHEGITTRPIVGGSASIDADGVITGTVLTLQGDATVSTAVDGLMAADKRLVAASLRLVDGEMVESGLALMQRQPIAAYTAADLLGPWTIDHIVLDPFTSERSTALRGTLDVTAGGAATSTLIDALGNTQVLTGTAAVDTAGLVTLTLDFGLSDLVLVMDGTMLETKRHVIGADTIAEPGDPTIPRGLFGVGLLSLVKAEPTSTVQFARPAYTVREGATSASISVARAGALGGTVTVPYAVDDTGAWGLLTFPPNVGSRSFSVPILDNTSVDGNRSIALRLGSPVGNARLGVVADATLVIQDDDRGGVIGFGAAAYSVGEGAGQVTLTVLRSGGAAGDVFVDFTTLDGSAVGGVEGNGDFDTTSGTLTFGPGATSATITVRVTQDSRAEGNETFQVQLANVRGGATLGSPAVATVTIVDDESAFQFDTGAFTVTEGTASAAIKVVRTGPLTTPATVAYSAAAGTAVAGRDFTPVAGVLTFPANTPSKTFNVPILSNTLLDGHRSVLLALGNPTGAQLGPRSAATLTIRDDEQAGTFRLDKSAYSVRESSGSLAVTIVRTGTNLAGNVSVGFITLDGLGNTGARAGLDYVATDLVVTFQAGEKARTVHVPILVDDLVEGNETFTVALANPGSGATLGSPASATVAVVDESSVLEFSGRFCTTVACAGKGNFPEVVRTGSLLGTVAAHYRAVSGSAVLGEDFRLPPGLVVFPPGVRTRLLPLTILGDNLAEGGETLRLELFDPSPNARLGEDATLTATIADEDFGGVVQFGAASQSVASAPLQAGANVSVAIVRTGGTGTVLTVSWNAVGGTLTPSPATGSVTFGPRDTVKRFTVSVASSDPIDKTVVLGLSFPEGAARLGAVTTTILHVPAPPPVPAVLQFDRAAYSVPEGGAATLTITRTGNLNGSVSVEFVTVPGTATFGDDYTLAGGSVTLGNGSASATISAPTLADALPDTPETFTVTLRNPSPTAVLGTPASAVVTITAPLPPPAPYTLTPIAFAGLNASFSAFTGVPTVNDTGTVAFAGHLPDEDDAIWIGMGGGPTLRAIASPPEGGGFPHDRFPIDDTGHVALDTLRPSGESAVSTVDGVHEPVLVQATDEVTRAFAPPSLSRTGRVAFKASLAGAHEQIVVGTPGESLTAVAQAPGAAFTTLGDRPVVSAGNAVAFLAEPAAGGGTGLFTATVSGETITVVPLVTADRFAFDGHLAISAGGAVAFAGAPAAGGQGVFVAHADGSVTTVAATGGPFVAFGAEGADATPQMNDAGTVAFLAFLDDGGHGIFTGPDPVRDKVIRTGDLLDGSAVSVVELGGLNEAGQVVFRASLEDGRRVIALATPPPAQADLSLAQTVDTATPAAGTAVTFTLTARNHGPGIVPDVLVEDMLPTGYTFVSATPSQGTTLLFMGRMLIWSVGSLTASGSNSAATLSVVATVQATGDHDNTATISTSSVLDPDATNNTATATVTPIP
jgi:uncharacterized repeat protein (TIGR01451 family)